MAEKREAQTQAEALAVIEVWTRMNDDTISRWELEELARTTPYPRLAKMAREYIQELMEAEENERVKDEMNRIAVKRLRGLEVIDPRPSAESPV